MGTSLQDLNVKWVHPDTMNEEMVKTLLTIQENANSTFVWSEEDLRAQLEKSKADYPEDESHVDDPISEEATQTTFFLVSDGDEKIGFVVTTMTRVPPPDDDPDRSAIKEDNHIDLFILARSAQNRGIGAIVLKAIIERWLDDPYSTLTVQTQESNEVARALYEGAGFKVFSETPNYYENGEKSINYYMEWNEQLEKRASRTKGKKKPAAKPAGRPTESGKNKAKTTPSPKSKKGNKA